VSEQARLYGLFVRMGVTFVHPDLSADRPGEGWNWDFGTRNKVGPISGAETRQAIFGDVNPTIGFVPIARM
jgi:hypothetical protein